jgi:chemotaxis protein MotB
LGLSMARAGSVAEYLLRTTSIDPKRLSTMGFGEYRPLASNDTAQGRQKNRRVEIIVSK